MINYNFLNLSYIEFESLVQDILQEDLKIILERFTSGRDGGIDLRYSAGENNLIIQCKRYENFSSLFSNLKKEVAKVRLLNPSRYIIATSVGLTPLQKDKIINLFIPYIVNDSDIIGREGLNSSLARHERIEKRHFKLWLPSTNILEKILHSKTFNQSQFKAEEISERINIYVQNDSFTEALEIIKEKNFVIISGIPGIGKSTLAYMLVYYFLAENFDEFVFLSDNINDGYEFYVEGKKQIFLFDDFLGASLLEDKLLRNEEKKIIEFIEKISKSKNKILILTTREYVLSQARNKFEPFERFNWGEAKCIIDLSKYIKPTRAKILYNHMYFSALSKQHLEEILIDNRYLDIINHPYYNPRIIERLTIKKQWEDIEPENFYGEFINFLDHPEDIWNLAFTKKISELSKYILIIFATAGSPILLDDLRMAILSFVDNYGGKHSVMFNEALFKESLRELENTFITINKDSKNNFFVEFQNPSIYDFLIKFIKDDNTLINELITSAVFLNQLLTIFSANENTWKKIPIVESNLNTYIRKIIDDFESMGRSSLIHVTSFESDEINFWAKRELSTLYKINEILKSVDCNNHDELNNFLISKLENLSLQVLSSDEQSHLLNIFTKINVDVNVDFAGLFSNIHLNIEHLYDIENLLSFKIRFLEEYNQYVNKENLDEKMKSIVGWEVDSSSKSEQEDLLPRIIAAESEFEFSASEEIAKLESKIDEKTKESEERWGNLDPDNLPDVDDIDEDTEDLVIIDMFDSFKYPN